MRLPLTALALLCPSTASGAAEVCHTHSSGQFGETRWCVSSVLPPQAGNTYGPEHLIGTDDSRAWCEGAPGPGIGQSITLHMKPPGHFRTISLTNGYVKSAETFRRNGRIKRVQLETSGGFKTAITVRDTTAPQRFRIPTTRAAWVRLTILDIYPGTQGTDTCVSWFSVDHEELNG